MPVRPEALNMLESTSRTFFLPISRLPELLQEAVTSAYLCMRALDEIEDHPLLPAIVKARQLRAVSALIQAQTTVERFDHAGLATIFADAPEALPAVTTQLGVWATLAPASIAPRIWDATAATAERMAHWVEANWRIRTEADLDRYTYGVAGAVGLLICDIGAWSDNIQMHRVHAIQFGRGLQAVNILRNRAADLERGVDFFPDGWTSTQMHIYARRYLSLAGEYAQTLPHAPFTHFIQLPLALALATLDTMAEGGEKLSRREVQTILQQLDQQA